MNTTKMIMAVASAAFATQFAGAVPVVSSVDMNQSSKTVVITYTLSGEDAVVTLDVLYGNTLYKMNSQDDSVQYGNVAVSSLGNG